MMFCHSQLQHLDPPTGTGRHTRRLCLHHFSAERCKESAWLWQKSSSFLPSSR